MKARRRLAIRNGGAFPVFDEVAVTAVFRFKHFDVRPAGRSLTVNGQQAQIGSRAFDLLLVLIERRDRVVTKLELMATLWPGMVVEENNLQIHVSALRKLIGAAAIATVQGRGYRFVLAPEAEPAAPDSLPGAPLPGAASGLLGREGEIAALLALMRCHALVTLVGAGGIGKTVLALEAARQLAPGFAGGACWVDLACLPAAAERALIAAAIAQALQLPPQAADQFGALMQALAARSALLVLDNAEHLIDGAADCARAIVEAAPGMRLLVTSQAPLRLPGELVVRIEALAVAPPGTVAAEAEQYGAVALFAQQARALDPGFAIGEANVGAVLAICRHLDGVPLALKLAASRLTLLSPEAIAARLGESMRLLRADQRQVPDRQQTIEAALDWSHALLSAPQQQLLGRLSVFVGGFSLAAAIAFAGQDGAGQWDVIDLLQGLAERCLLDVCTSAGADPRYRLPECTRQYAAMQLARRGDARRWQRAHALACLALIEQMYDSYWHTPDQQWLARYEPDLDNLRLALDWCSEGDPPLALRMMAGSGPFFMLLGLAHEARRRYADLAHLAEHGARDADCAPWLARYWLERSRLEWGVSHEAMLGHAQRALALYRLLADARGIYLALRCAAAAAAVLDPAAAQAMLAEMAASELSAWGTRVCAQGLLATANVQLAAGRLPEARKALEALLLLDGCGFEATVSAALSGLAALSLQEGDSDAALDLAGRLLARKFTHRGNFLLHAQAMAAMAWLLKGQPRSARQVLRDFARASCLRNWEWLGLYTDLFALLAATEGRVIEAARILGCADALRPLLGRRDPLAADAAARALVLCRQALGERALAQLQADGAGIDAASMCALAFGDGWDSPSPPPGPIRSPGA